MLAIFQGPCPIKGWVGSSPATRSMSGNVGEGASEAGGGNKGTAPGGGV